MNRRLTVAIAATAAVGICSAGLASTAGAAAKKNEIIIKGNFEFRAGKGARDNQRFAPLRQKVKSGSTVTVRNRSKTEDPHTLSFIEKAFLPDELRPSGSRARCSGSTTSTRTTRTPCRSSRSTTARRPPTRRLPWRSTRSGPTGRAATRCCSSARQPVTFDVTAAAGSKLYYFCIFHPWMQGRISVR